MKILLLLVVVIQNCCPDSFMSKFHQHDYKIKDYRQEAVSYDENFVKVWKIASFRYNRTTRAHNITVGFKETLGRKLVVLIQGYKFLSNEYRRIQLRFQENVCIAYYANIFGIREGASNCGNLTDCYFYKDRVYHICNYLNNEGRFPPFIPTGQYKFSQKILYMNQEIAEANAYLEIYRPIYPKN